MEAVETNAEIMPPPPKSMALAKPTTPRAIIMAEALKEDTEQRTILGEYVKRHMIGPTDKEPGGVDYGIIPGTKKPTLLKPGAEKLVDLFRCTAEYEQTSKVEDWDHSLFHYEFKVKIRARDTGQVLAEGVGSANSREARYRWRDSKPACPKCGKETIKKSKYPPRGTEDPPGWYCYAKLGGCGAEFAHDDVTIVGQEMGRVENDDVFTLVNTILKMAKKRALVDGAIALARCSDIFTQDVEDLEGHDAGEWQPRAPAPKAGPRQHPEQPKGVAESRSPELQKRRMVIAQRIKKSGTDFARFVADALGAAKPSDKWIEEDLRELEKHLAETEDVRP